MSENEDGITGLSMSEPAPVEDILSLNPEYELIRDLQVTWLNDVIARGDSGVVYKGCFTDKDGEKVAAIKQFEIQFGSGGRRLSAVVREAELAFLKNEFLREAYALSICKHENVVKMYGYVSDVMAIVEEFVDGDLLEKILRNKKGPKLGLEKAIYIAIQICCGMKFIHENNIVHRDLKPDNIILRKDGVVKIIDFGCARVIGEKMTPEKGNKDFRAPEVDSGLYNEKADMFSFSYILLELLNEGKLAKKGEKSFLWKKKKGLIEATASFRPENWSSTVPKELINFISTCWDGNFMNRPSFAQIEAFLKRFKTVHFLTTGVIAGQAEIL